MESIKNLKWTDLISPTITPDEYLEHYKDKIANNYKTYKTNKLIIEKLNKILVEKNEKLYIIALGADWCPDCSLNIPRMIKIIKLIDNKKIEFRILYGIMVNALHKPDEIIWHKKRSPPEAINPKFNLKAIPTFYFFNKAEDLLDVIVEKPKVDSSLEEELLVILENHL